MPPCRACVLAARVKHVYRRRIIGDVQDEFETDGEDIVIIDQSTTRVSELLSLDDVNERFDLRLDDPYYNTIGGYLFGQIGRRPEIGDVLTLDSLTLTVATMDGNRIDRVDISRAPTDTPTSSPETTEQPSSK